MSFSFGASQPTTGFSLTPASSSGGGGAGDGPSSTAGGFSFGSNTTAITTSTSIGAPSSTVMGLQPPSFSLNPTSSAPNSTGLSFSFGSTATSSKAPTLNPTTSITPAVSTIGTTNVTSASGGITSATTQPGINFGFSTSTTSASVTPAIAVTSAPLALPSQSILPNTGILSYNQLEDAINKWTIDLEEQEKLFTNQAKQLNAWDHLLISNGEKVLQLSNNIEKVKQQQEQLDQELDFVLAQQKELESCIIPLEKELQDVPVQDTDRKETYQLAENLDSQLKQMSEDLKEVIEYLNESTKSQEMSDPITQISRILNVHMDSLQWIDRNTAQISEQLDQIAKMQENTKHII